jgi:metallo-beta-lactamase family protein
VSSSYARERRRPTLTFLGGVGTVTGSKHLLDTAGAQILVDCGLFQGLSALRRRNWAEPPIDWRRLDAVVITHAHLDHSGYLPVLARHGWAGPVYVTEGTAGLAEIVLADSAHLQEEDARFANTRGWTKHHPAVPLYDARDAARACALFQVIKHGESVPVNGDVRLTFGRAGHILGSSWAKLDVNSTAGIRTAVFSGDLGRQRHPLLRPPEDRPTCDTLVLESTYGDRRHDPAADAFDRLAGTINRTIERGGSVLVPAFAVDRTEVLLSALTDLMAGKRIPRVPIVVDSPMALACLNTYRDAIDRHAPELRDSVTRATIDPGNIVEVRTAEESMQWNDPALPAIIISASGMATGGRVLHHLRHMLPNRRHTVAVFGFAAEGSRARQLADRATAVKIHGEYVPVRAEIAVFDAFSAHADADELVGWAAGATPPSTCYVVHGELHSSRALAERLDRERGWLAVVPKEGERVLV